MGLEFLIPGALVALVALPLIWLLLKLTPPPAQRVTFPGLFFLRDVEPKEQEASAIPLWLLLLRLLMVALIILALAHPVLRRQQDLGMSAEDGPLLLVMDNGWAAAELWEQRVQKAESLLQQAARQERPVWLVATAESSAPPPDLLTAEQALQKVRLMEPKPWPAGLQKVGERLEGLEAGRVIWIHDGLGGEPGGALLKTLIRAGPTEVVRGPEHETPLVLLSPEMTGSELTLTARRFDPKQALPIRVQGYDENGAPVFSREMHFAPGALTARQAFELPVPMLRKLFRLEIDGQKNAGAVALRPSLGGDKVVGILAPEIAGEGQPLLSEVYYVEKALTPVADVRFGSVQELATGKTSMIVLPDSGGMEANQRQRLEEWVEAGGLLLRFAGPLLAAGELRHQDLLLPVALRQGGRELGGVLTWDEPVALETLPEHSPFYGLEIPRDVTVKSQLLASPSPDLFERSWALLKDGTPLVTYARRGQGKVVLFHTTANTRWSNLALSGLFVKMLERVLELSEGSALLSDYKGALEPVRTLNGFGELTLPPAGAEALEVRKLASLAPGAAHPPGLYGSGGVRRAVNLGEYLKQEALMGTLPAQVLDEGLDSAEVDIDLKPWLLLVTFVLFLADMIISLVMRGLLPLPARGLSAFLLICLISVPETGMAISDKAAALNTRLAYVMTGRADIDRISRAGLTGLTRVLARRTSFEGAEPAGIDLERDDPAFYPFLYWPVSAGQTEPSAQAMDRLNRYLQGGGTIVFDTRGETVGLIGMGGNGGAVGFLFRVLSRLDVGQLMALPDDHVLTRTFYLLKEFPGRIAGQKVILEEAGPNRNDGVASVIITSHDWAAAWAIDESGKPVQPLVPGGERQREMAYRTGVNLLMYTLTGSYKTDQIHLPKIMERLGGGR